MKRAVLLGTSAHPLILRLWLEMFKIWEDEIDAVYIAIDSLSIPNTRDYIVNLCKQFPKVKLLENASGWPNCYKDAYLASKEDNFLIMHDDTLVHKRGVVDKFFKIAESGKVVVPLNQIYSPAETIENALKAKYDFLPLKLLDKRGFLGGYEGYSFLLYFLFISRINLEKTSIDFNGIGWEKDQDIPTMGIKGPAAGDTGFILALDLFAKNVPFHIIPRFETATLPYEGDALLTLTRWMKNKEQIFDPEAGWLHLQNTGNTIPLWFKEDLDAREWHKNIEEVRLAWLSLMLQIESYADIPEFKKLADGIFNGVMVRCGADPTRIEMMSNIFSSLIYG